MLLYQNKNGYCFNSDTHFLYDFISTFSPKGEVLDIGSGCGILGLLIARDFNVKLTQIDIQKENVFLTSKNASVNRIKSEVILMDFAKSDFRNRFDFIVSNPPFYHDNHIKSLKKHLFISRYACNLPLDIFIKNASLALKPKGRFIFCYDPKTLDLIFEYLEKYKLKASTLRFVHPNREKKANLVMIEARKNSKSFLEILPPLIAHENKEFSKEAMKIFKKTKTHSIKCLIEIND